MNDAHHEAADGSPPKKWSVWRIDDNGNTFLVRVGLSLAEAERLVEVFTARGHKQTYWTEEVKNEHNSSD